MVFIIKRWPYEMLMMFFLSKKTNAKEAVNSLSKLSHPLNCFLAACYEVFDRVDSLEYNKTTKTTSYLRDFNSHFSTPIRAKLQSRFIKIYLFIKSRLNIIYKAIIYKEYRVWLFNLLTDKDWQKRKLVALGWKPKYDLDSGLRDALKWYKENKDQFNPDSRP